MVQAIASYKKYVRKNSQATFQRTINNILRGFQGIKGFIYLDDVIIHGKNLNEHNNKLAEIFDICRQSNLKLQSAKCQFLKKEITFLGHLITPNGIKPNPNPTHIPPAATIPAHIQRQVTATIPAQHIQTAAATPAQHIQTAATIPAQHIQTAATIPAQHIQTAATIPAQHIQIAATIPGYTQKQTAATIPAYHTQIETTTTIPASHTQTQNQTQAVASPTQNQTQAVASPTQKQTQAVARPTHNPNPNSTQDIPNQTQIQTLQRQNLTRTSTQTMINRATETKLSNSDVYINLTRPSSIMNKNLTVLENTKTKTLFTRDSNKQNPYEFLRNFKGRTNLEPIQEKEIINRRDKLPITGIG